MLAPGTVKARVAVATIMAAGVVTAVVVGLSLRSMVQFGAHAPAPFWGVAVMAVVVDLPLLGLRPLGFKAVRATLSASVALGIFVIWGAAPAIVVQAVAAIATGVGQRHRRLPIPFFVARLVLALAAAEVVVTLTQRREIVHPSGPLDGPALSTGLELVAVWLLVNYGMLELLGIVLLGRGARFAAIQMRGDLYSTTAALLLIPPLLALLPGWWALLLTIPLLAWNLATRDHIQREQRLARDPVTGLLNRSGLADQVETLLTGDMVNPLAFGVAFVDVEAAVAINRDLSREIYEDVVREAARRLVAGYRMEGVGWLTGEGFVIIIPGLRNDAALAAAQRSLTLLSPPVEVGDIPFGLHPTVGVALSPEHGRDLTTLLSRAEQAITQARREGVSACIYRPSAAGPAQRRVALLGEAHAMLRDPRRHAELAVLYQPQVEIATGRLAGVEALVRWHHPTWGQVPTDELIEAVESSEVMHKLTLHVMATTIAQLGRWNDQGLAMRGSVNVSVDDLDDPGFVTTIEAMLHRHSVAATQLTVEITERTLTTETERVSRAARLVADLGVGLSLDDFGTGYASIQQLRSLPLTEVKIDKAYICDVAGNEAERAIVTSVHQLARAIELSVVAEGVADEQIAGALAGLPGIIGQGWHYGRAMTAGDLEQWYRARGSP